ncbi:MAG: TrbG/VirB9 family P-type conjugative transfer protein [Candidatus Baltobacteraceae bacterium]
MRAVAFLVFFATLVTAPALARGSGGPVRYSDGSYRYEFGGGIPTIRVGAGDSCDIELQAGETIRRAFLSDTVRWKLADGVSGANNVPHLVVKPTQSGIWTTLTVFTDRRSYHIRLTSSQNLEAEYVGFTYDADRAAAAKQANDQARAAAAAAAAIDATYTCKDLDAKYVASGANEFRNAQVCNDGKHTYINAPDWSGDLPMPYSLDNGTDEIANYSFDPRHRQFILDGVPKKLALIRGSDHGQLRTTFERKTQ